MSRWKEKFEKYSIPENLEEAIELTNTSFPDMNADTIIEKRRLLKVIQIVGNFVKNMDSEVVPAHILNSIEARLQNALTHLRIFQKQENISSLQNANNELDALLQDFPLLMMGGKKTLTEKRSKDMEKLFDDFVEKFASKTKDLEETIKTNTNTTTGHENKLGELSSAVTTRQNEIDELVKKWEQSHSDAKVNWDSNLTSAKADWDSNLTSAKEDLSNEKEKFDTAIVELNDKKSKDIEDRIKIIMDKGNTEIDENITKTKNMISERKEALFEQFAKDEKEIDEKHDEMLTQCGLVMGDTIAGGHTESAKAEKTTAITWNVISFTLLFCVIAWSIFIYSRNGNETNMISAIINFLQAAPVVGTGLFGAIYALKQANWYRNSGDRKRQFALEIVAITPFIENLKPESQLELKKKLTEKLFGNFYSENNGSSKGTDINLVKEIIEIVKTLNTKE